MIPDDAKQALVKRFESYFTHQDLNHPVVGLGDRAVACRNLRLALTSLGFSRESCDDEFLFDQPLSDAVLRFQCDSKCRSNDGRVGPGTRSQLVLALIEQFGVAHFAKLDDSDIHHVPTVFLSYAWADSPKVNKLDQWLRDNGVRVIRDIDAFEPGSDVKLKIRQSVMEADKVIAVYSENSRNRDWPTFEHQIAEQMESIVKTPVLVYLLLDGAPLKAHDPHRIFIDAQANPLRVVGSQILHALGMPNERARYEYDEDEMIGSSSKIATFVQQSPTFGPSQFWDQIEWFGVLANTGGLNLRFGEGERLFLRLIPTAPIPPIKTTQEALVLMVSQGKLLVMTNDLRSANPGRNKHGVFMCDFEQHEFDQKLGVIRSVSQLFLTRELWGIDGRTINSKRLKQRAGVDFGFFPCTAFENVFTITLRNYLDFANRTLKIPLPLKVVAGATNVIGYRMSLPKSLHGGFSGPTVEDSIFFEGEVHDYSESPFRILRPFFELVWDKCGIERPKADVLE